MNANRFLIAVDGSDQAAEAVRYAGAVLPKQESQIVLLHVMSSIPEVLRDIEADSSLKEASQAAREWEELQRKKAQGFMEESFELLIQAGFPARSVSVEIRDRKEGLARDISAEACGGGYTALILGRIGTNPLHRSILGSIATKVTEGCRLPVWIIGGTPAWKRVLVGLDSSAGSMAAVAHVGKVVDKATREVRLVHVVRTEGELPQSFGHKILESYFKEIRRTAEKEIKPVFEEARGILTGTGMSPERITSKLITEDQAVARGQSWPRRHGRTSGR